MKKEQVLNLGSSYLPKTIELMIFEFLKSEEMLFIISMICKDFSTITKDFYRNSLGNEFSEYFDKDELKSVSPKDSQMILALMIMHRRFTTRIHLHDTPYYSNLIKQNLKLFLKSKNIEAFPWAAVIMGNLMRVEEKKEAAKYFKMAIQLPIAKTLMAITYSTPEIKEMKLLEVLKNSEQWLPPKFRINYDFIICHLQNIQEYIRNQHLFNIHDLGSKAFFELLENNFRYFEIILRWQGFEGISQTKVQYIKEKHAQMQEEKDPILASHMAAGLVQVYIQYFVMCQPTEEVEDLKIDDQRIEDCIQKGGFDLMLVKCYENDNDKLRKILSNICQSKTPVRPGLLGPCALSMANLMAKDLMNGAIKSKNIYQETIITLSFFWMGIVNGLSKAVLDFNIFVNQWLPNSMILQSKCQADLTKDLSEETRLLIFRIFFAAQHSYKSLTVNYEDIAKKNLLQYREHENGYVSASANMALGLRGVKEGNEVEAELYFDDAGKNMSACSDYLEFTKQQGYRLPPSVAESKSFRLISEWIKSSHKSIGATTSTLSLQ